MILLYNIGITLLDNAIKLASFFHPKAKAFVTGRRDLLSKVERAFANNESPVVWFHCASLGEFEQARPVIESLKKEYNQYKILLTFFSPSGFEVRKNYPLADFVFYLPIDKKTSASRWVKAVRPSLAIFVKYEFWYHFAHELKKSGIPILSISSIFRDKHVAFKPYGKFQRDTLAQFTHFFVQNAKSRDLLSTINLTNTTVVGDTRFDRVFQILKQGEPINLIEKFKNKQQVFVIGSSWQQDMDVLLPFINENRLKFVIAPHETSPENIAEIEKGLRVSSVRFSQAADHSVEDVSVLIIDNIGMLSKLYRYGEFAFIGGAYGKGLHNILEAACYGIPVLFGDQNYEKFQEAVDLINRGGAYAVKDYPDLIEKYEMLNVPENFQLACAVTRQYVEENLGATEKIMQYCRTILKKNKQATIL